MGADGVYQEKDYAMKPYGLVLHNLIKLNLMRIFRCSQLRFCAVELLDRRMRFRLNRNAQVSLGEHLVSDGHATIIVDDGGKLQIGSRVYFNEDMMISTKSSVTIGDGCRFGPGVKIFDNDHAFNAENGVSDKHVSEAISIGGHCWIAANVVILKGTQIGKNCVVGAGTVVHGIIPDGSIVTTSRELIVRPIGARRA